MQIMHNESDDMERLIEIKEEMTNLLEEAGQIISQHPQKIVWERARAYWYAHIMGALDNDNEYGNRYDTTMQTTIDEMSDKEDDDED
jgi:hypothetical protein